MAVAREKMVKRGGVSEFNEYQLPMIVLSRATANDARHMPNTIRPTAMPDGYWPSSFCAAAALISAWLSSATSFEVLDSSFWSTGWLDTAADRPVPMKVFMLASGIMTGSMNEARMQSNNF